MAERLSTLPGVVTKVYSTRGHFLTFPQSKKQLGAAGPGFGAQPALLVPFSVKLKSSLTPNIFSSAGAYASMLWQIM